MRFNTATNQISGFSYDAAGNMINDGSHIYSYDAEGNLSAVDNGSTAQYTYDALNHRVQALIMGYPIEYVFNAAGQRTSAWNGSNNTLYRGQYYWGAAPLAFYYNGQTYFQHQDWVGTERARTNYNGDSAATFTSLPFGDAQPRFMGYKDLDPNRIMNESLGLPAGMRLPTGHILHIFGVGGGVGCEFGACGGYFSKPRACRRCKCSGALTDGSTGLYREHPMHRAHEPLTKNADRRVTAA
jgi:hypothetical protein